MPSKNLQPALIGGLFIGVLSALPIIQFGNCLCCMWVIGGGIITAYLMQNASSVALTVGDGAVGGLIAGLIGAPVHAVLSVPMNLIMAPMKTRFLQQFMENAQDMPTGLRDLMQNATGGAAGVALSFISTLIFSLFAGAIFATIGGMIGVAIFSRGKPSVAAGPPMPPPPSPASPIPPSPPPPQA